MELEMVSKVERERAALEAAERDLAERKTRLAELEKQEAEKELQKLLKRVGNDRARRLMELAVAVKPKVAIEALEKMVPSGSGKPS
ncbi:MAG: hypothetical protein JKX86_06280 [Verrucomicrobiales bacterium]|nr:hypothetical protein [Verrucomicrobiales bacterium]